MSQNGAWSVGDSDFTELHRPFQLSGSGDLGHDRDGDLRRAACPDRKSDGAMDAAQIRLLETGRRQPLAARPLRLLRPQCPDIEASGVERRIEGRIVDLRIMRQRHQRGARSEIEFGQDLVGPFIMHHHIREAFGRGKGGPGPITVTS